MHPEFTRTPSILRDPWHDLSRVSRCLRRNNVYVDTQSKYFLPSREYLRTEVTRRHLPVFQIWDSVTWVTVRAASPRRFKQIPVCGLNQPCDISSIELTLWVRRCSLDERKTIETSSKHRRRFWVYDVWSMAEVIVLNNSSKYGIKLTIQMKIEYFKFKSHELATTIDLILYSTQRVIFQFTLLTQLLEIFVKYQISKYAHMVRLSWQTDLT